MASRCAVMNRGLLQQVATPSDLYEFPNSRFVADFIGSVNLFEGALTLDEPDEAAVTSAEAGTPIYFDHGVTGAEGASVWVGIRPEKIMLHKHSGSGSAPATSSPASPSAAICRAFACQDRSSARWPAACPMTP